MPYHEVKQGETLLGLAAANGLKSWQEILDRPENAELKKARPDPGILKAGDRVFIPNRELRQQASAVDKLHSFKIPRPQAWVRLAVKDAAGEPYAGKKYELTVEGATTRGVIPAGGVVEQAVPVDAASGRLTVWTDEATSEVWELEVGHMDPAGELSGVQARLNNLGFDCGELDGALDEETRAAVRTFQARVGLDPTGEVDDALRRKLLAYYQPGEDEREHDAKAAEQAKGAEQATDAKS